MIENNSDTTRRIYVRLLFQERPSREHNELGVDIFYAWLEKRRPELLNWGPQDPHEQLYRDLEGLYE